MPAPATDLASQELRIPDRASIHLPTELSSLLAEKWVGKFVRVIGHDGDSMMINPGVNSADPYYKYCLMEGIATNNGQLYLVFDYAIIPMTSVKNIWLKPA